MTKKVTIIILIFLSILQIGFSQVEKNKSKYIVPNIGGIRKGIVTRAWLLSQNKINFTIDTFFDNENRFVKLKIENDTTRLNGKIIKYNFDIMNYKNTFHRNMVYQTDSITSSAKNIINNIEMGKWVYFTPYYLTNKGDTVIMPSIHLTIKN